MKTVVLGAGALGCAMGGVLAEAGHEVWLLNRNRAHVQALRRDGLVLVEEGVERVVRVHAACEPGAVDLGSRPVDLVIVLVKSFHTHEAVAATLGLMAPRTVVVSLQNGLGHEDVLCELVGRERVIAGKTYVGGVLLGPGRVEVSMRGKETILGELDNQPSARLADIAARFDAAGLATRVSTNILGTMWDKLLVNVATGALSGITRLSYGALYQVPEIEACAVAAVAEAMAVAHAGGITLRTTDARSPWHMAAAGLPPSFKASMLQSLEKGSITEVDYINGAVVRWGLRHGVATPVNQALVACIKGVEHGLGVA